jgi:hypothetical protein
MARARRVDDGQAAMAQTRAPPIIIYLKGCPHALIITPAMLKALKHPLNTRSRIYTDDSGNTAHNKEADLLVHSFPIREYAMIF